MGSWSPGGDAGKGSNGGSGIDAINPTTCDEYIKTETFSCNFLWLGTGEKKLYRKKGGKGGRGGDAGRAGEGGYGGNAGIIQIFNGNGLKLQDATKLIVIETNQGTRGKNGSLGIFGEGGFNGNNRTIWYNYYDNTYENEDYEVITTHGPAGNPTNNNFIPPCKRETLPSEFWRKFYLAPKNYKQGLFYEKIEQEFPMKYLTCL